MAGVRAEVVLVSLATHFTAVLLGISAATVLEGDAWPAAALRLDSPSLLIGLPTERSDIGSFVPGDKVKLVKPGGEPCAFQSKAMSLLSVTPVVLVAQNLDAVNGEDIRALAEWTSSAGTRVALAGAKAIKCKDAAQLDVVVDR